MFNFVMIIPLFFILVVFVIIAISIIRIYSTPIQTDQAVVISKRTSILGDSKRYYVSFEINGNIIECKVYWEIYHILNEGDQGILNHKKGIFVSFDKN